MTTTEPALQRKPPRKPHSLNRITVHKEGLSWEVFTGAPTPANTSTEWAEAIAFAVDVAERWRSHFVGFTR